MKALLFVFLFIFSTFGVNEGAILTETVTVTPQYIANVTHQVRLDSGYTFADSIAENITSLFARVDAGQLDAYELIANPYAVSAVYYSDDFYKKLLDYRRLDPEGRKIAAAVLKCFTPQIRSKCIASLNRHYIADRATAGNTHAPLDEYYLGKGVGHTDAIDLFVKREGMNVYSISDGLVVLAESGWNIANQQSTSSYRGGNTVIVFQPAQRRFYRYAHLEKVFVLPGHVISSGTVIGTVGRTGSNASRPGHGRHLHLEIHEYPKDGEAMKSMHTDRLKRRIALSN